MMAVAWGSEIASVRHAGRLDPDYFDPRVEEVEVELRRLGAPQLGVHVESAGRGVSPDYSPEGGVRVVKTANVRRFELSANPVQYVTEDFASANPTALIPRGALLITATGVGSAGRTFVKIDHSPMLADGHVTVIRLKSLTLAAYLCAFLQSPIGRQQLLRLRRGSSRQIEIYPEDILSVLVPSLTPSRQRSISRRWLTAVRRVHAAVAATHEAEQMIMASIGLDEQRLTAASRTSSWSEDVSFLKASRRIDAECAGPEVEYLRGLLVKAHALPLSQLILSVRKGVQPEHYIANGPVRVVKSKDVDYPEMDLRDCLTTSDTGWSCYLTGGELLLNATGEGTLGRAGVVPAGISSEPPLIPAVDLHVLDVDRSAVLPEYLALYLNSAIGRRLTTSVQTGSSGQQHLYPDHFALIPVPIPRDRGGRPDLGWQRRSVAVASVRGRALAAARATAAELDDEFLADLGIRVDLSMLPS